MIYFYRCVHLRFQRLCLLVSAPFSVSATESKTIDAAKTDYNISPKGTVCRLTLQRYDYGEWRVGACGDLAAQDAECSFMQVLVSDIYTVLVADITDGTWRKNLLFGRNPHLHENGTVRDEPFAECLTAHTRCSGEFALVH